MATLAGRCLCGAVSYAGKGATRVGACHCTDCRRWTGGAFIGVSFEDGVTINESPQLNWFASSDWASRGSCSRCGTALFYRLNNDPAHVIVTAGSIDDQDALPAIEEHIFIDSKPNYYEFHDEAPRVTGAEIFARHAPKDE